MIEYFKLSDNELIGQLYSAEDRLPRLAVDEMARRGERMVPLLSEIVSDQFNWNKDVPEWWAVVHASFILGAIGTPSTIIPLLRALRWADAFDCDWVTNAMPVMLASTGPAAVDRLMTMASDNTNGCYTRVKAMEGLGCIVGRHPDSTKEIVAFVHGIFMDHQNDLEARKFAGGVLLDLKIPEYKDDLLIFGRQEDERKCFDQHYPVYFSEDCIERSFTDDKRDVGLYDRDWLTFYDEDEIRQRQERWKKEFAQDSSDEDEDFLEHLDLPRPEPYIRQTYIGRNDPCPCGSGKKYKKCCLNKTSKS